MKKKYVIYNSTFAIIQKIIEMVLAFIFRTVLIYTLGKEYLGLSGLFTNIFSVLSLMELGIGSSIVFLMYEPINNKDYETLKCYLNAYAKFYAVVGILVLITGIALIPFLPLIISDYDTIEINLIPIYLLTLLNVVMSYFLAHRRSLLEADQKNYINSLNYSFFGTIGTILRIVVLLTLKDYNLTLFITLSLTVVSNINIYNKTNRIYPFLKIKTTKRLEKYRIKEIYKRMYASSIHQIGNIVITSTDNIVISTFVNLATVGIYSNYSMLTNMIYSMFSLIFISITSTIGNMRFEESLIKIKRVFNNMLFLNFYLYFTACSLFFALANDFISIWIGNDYFLPTTAVFLITINLYIMGMRNTIITFINSSGLSYNTRYKSIYEVTINLVVSVYLVQKIGVSGVVIGTIVSFLTVSVWYEPYILYKYWFNGGLGAYYSKYLGYFVMTIICMISLFILNEFIAVNSFYIIFIKGISYFILINLIIILLFHKSDEFIYFKEIIKTGIIYRLKRGR